MPLNFEVFSHVGPLGLSQLEVRQYEKDHTVFTWTVPLRLGLHFQVTILSMIQPPPWFSGKCRSLQLLSPTPAGRTTWMKRPPQNFHHTGSHHFIDPLAGNLSLSLLVLDEVEEEMNLALKELKTVVGATRLATSVLSCGTGDRTEHEKSYLDAAQTNSAQRGNERHGGGGRLRGSHH